MRTFVVNLDRDVERLSSCREQLERQGVSFERFSAVYAADFSLSDKNSSYSRFGWWCATGRPIRNGELGCTLTHNRIYKSIIDQNIPCACVLEDDNLFAPHFAQQLAEIEKILDPQEKVVVLLTNYTGYQSNKKEIVPTKQNSSTEAYVVTQAAAQAILKVNDPICVPCDHWQRFSRLGGIQILQAFPTATLMHVARFGSYSAPPGTDLGLVSRMPFMKKMIHKTLRLVGLTLDRFVWWLR